MVICQVEGVGGGWDAPAGKARKKMHFTFGKCCDVVVNLKQITAHLVLVLRLVGSLTLLLVGGVAFLEGGERKRKMKSRR